jgi:hypothetical protein
MIAVASALFVPPIERGYNGVVSPMPIFPFDWNMTELVRSPAPGEFDRAVYEPLTKNRKRNALIIGATVLVLSEFGPLTFAIPRHFPVWQASPQATRFALPGH